MGLLTSSRTKNEKRQKQIHCIAILVFLKTVYFDLRPFMQHRPYVEYGNTQPLDKII